MIAELLTRIPLFATLEAEALSQVSNSTSIVEVTAGQYLFRRGDPGDALFIVETGLLEAVIDEDTVSERSLNTFFPRDFFGEMAILTNDPRSASIRALLDSRLIRLSQEKFAELLEQHPQIALHLSRMLSKYLSRTNMQLSQRSARITTIISVGQSTDTEAVATHLLASLVRQYEVPAILVSLDEYVLSERESARPTDIHELNSRVRSMPMGGQCLSLGPSTLQHMDDHALVAVINSLRPSYEHIVVWVPLAEAYRRLSFLARFDLTYFLVHAASYCSEEWKLNNRELANVVNDNLRLAYISSSNTKMSIIQVQTNMVPPLKITLLSGEEPLSQDIDRLARAMSGRTVGLALGSGTAQGLAHVGVMKALGEEGIPIDLIAGTSGGALYGSLTASGLSIEEAVSQIMLHTRRNLLDKLDFVLPLRGVIRGRRIEKMIHAIIGDRMFTDLTIPLYAIATDLRTGEEVVIEEGLVYQAVRASISVPGIFEPYKWNGRILVDGVVVNPLPVSIARQKGADIVLAVQVPAPGKVTMKTGGQRDRQPSYSIVSTIIRSHHIVGEKLADETASMADVLMKPDVTRFGWREYVSAPHITEEGYQAAKAAIPHIRHLVTGKNS